MAHQQARRVRGPAVYGGAVLLLLLAGLSLRGFSFDVGDAHVVGRYTFLPLLGTSSVESVTLSWNGLSLRFLRSGTPPLRAVERGDGENTIVLADGSRIRVAAGADPGGSLSITPAAGAAAVIPYALSGVETEVPSGAALSWRSSGRSFLLSLPAGAALDAQAGTITLRGSGAAVLSSAGTVAVSAPARVPDKAPAAAATQRLPAEKDLPSAAALQAAVAGWIDAAWAGFSGSRYSAADGSWALPGGARGVSDDLGIAYLAESVARGTWKTAVPAWTDAVARARAQGGDAGFLFPASVFAGGTQDFARAAAQRQAALLDKARTLLAAGDPAVFAIPDLVPLLRFHGTSDLVAAARALATGRGVSSAGIAQVLGLGESLLGLADPGSSGDPARAALRDLLSRAIVPGIRATDAGLFLAGTSGAVDVAASVRAGSLLLGAGAALSDSRTSALGRALLSASLALADDAGQLPATLRLSGAKVAGRAGTLAPESVYAEVPTGRPIPHELSLASSLGAGVTLFTAADTVTAQKTADGVSLLFAYPAGVPHYFVIMGLGPFGQVTLHGIPWHADPAYARYSDGWTYDPAARVFYGKLTGRTGQEEIDIAP